MCSRHGKFTIRILGFGWSLVSGRSRVPWPSGMIIGLI